MRVSRMQCPTGVWCLALLLISATGAPADEVKELEKRAKIGVNDEERFPVSEHEHPRENIPTRPDYRGPGHWATPAPDSGIELGFIPIKTYAQVRRSISVKHLPRSDALASATTHEERVNAPRLREVVTTKKITEVYTEEGYEDSAYDHGKYQKKQEKEEDYVKPAASSHQDSVAQGTNAVPKPGLPPGNWERHKVIRNETRMMFLGDNGGKDKVPMKVLASYSHTIQHPGGKGDVVESGSTNTPSNRKPSANRRSSKVPRSSPHFTENLAIPLLPNDASLVANRQQVLVGNRNSEVSHPTTVQNYPAVIMQHNSDESHHQLLLRNQSPMIGYSSLLQNPSVVPQHPPVASNTETLPLNTQNLALMLLANNPLQQAAAKLPQQLNQNQPIAFLQNNPQVKPNARSLPIMVLPGNSAETQNIRLLQQISDDSQAAFLSQAQPRVVNNRGKTRLMLVQNNSPDAPSNQPREVEISLHYKTPPVIIESDTPSQPAPRFLHPAQQRFQIYPRNLPKTKDDFLTPPPQYQLTSRELVAFAKSHKNSQKSQATSSNEINAATKFEKYKKIESSNNATFENTEQEDHTTARPVITNGHLPWGVIANEARKIPVSKLIPLKEFSDDDENPASNSPASSISKIIKPAKADDAPKNKSQKTTKTVSEPSKSKSNKIQKNLDISDPRKNDTYSNELPHLAKFVEALTLAHYAPKNEHIRGVAFKSSSRKHTVAKHADRNKELQDMLAKVYANKQKTIQARGRSTPLETSAGSYRGAVRHGGTSIQQRQPKVEHRVHPVQADSNFQQSIYSGMRNTNLAVNRAPRISRKADSNFLTKNVKYPSGDKEEARLEEEERLLEEEKDKELEENVAQWKQAILEVDNPKPEVDTKKYPFYYAPVTKSISPYSPLRYATNPKDIPKKTEGGMEFYESREKVQCPEVVGKLDIVPKRAKSGEWNTKPRAKLPRLRGLGDKIDCLKTKYFGEEPLDNPFFKEENVGLPKSTKNRRVERVSEAEEEIETDPLGLYADILKHVKSIGNPASFPLHSSSSHKSVKTKQKNHQESTSSNRPPESVASLSPEAGKSFSKASTQNKQENPIDNPNTGAYRKSKNKNLEAGDVPKMKLGNENYPVRTKRPLTVSNRQHPPHKPHLRVPKGHPEHSKRIQEEDKPHKKDIDNIQFQTGFTPLIISPAHSHANSPELLQQTRTNLDINGSPIERPHGMHYGVSPHPYKIVSPAENASVEVKARKDYNNIIGMQPPPVQKHRGILKTVHRKPKEYPTSVMELLPASPKVPLASSQRTPLKRIKDVPELSPPPLQYRLSPDGRIIETGGILANEGITADSLTALQQQHIDEMLASESALRSVFQQPALQVRSKRSAEFSEEVIPRVPLGVNDAAPLLQRRQDHVVVDRLGNMYYGHVNGDDAFWTSTGNDVDPHKQNHQTSNVLHDENANVNNDGKRGDPRYKTQDGKDINSSHYKPTELQKTSNNEDRSAATKKTNYNSITSLSSGERRFSLSNGRQAEITESKRDDLNEQDSSVRNPLNEEQEASNKKKGLPLTEAQSTPEVLSPEQINRILSGIMTRHSYSSRYRSDESPSNTTTTTSTTTSSTTMTTTEKPRTTSLRSTTRGSRRRPAKTHRVIPILNGRVIPELVTSTTKSPEIRKSRRRLLPVRKEVTTTTEATIRGGDRHQRQKTSRRGKSPWQESSTVSPNTRNTGAHRRRTYSGRENITGKNIKATHGKSNSGEPRATAETKKILNTNVTRSGTSIVNSQQKNSQAVISQKVSRISPTSQPESTTVPTQRVQAIETRRVTKEEIFTTRYYPQPEEDESDEEDKTLRNSSIKKRGDEEVDDDGKEIYEPYASQNFHSGNRRNTLNHDLWKGKSKVTNKNLEKPDTTDLPIQKQSNYFSRMSDELELERVESPKGSAPDELESETAERPEGSAPDELESETAERPEGSAADELESESVESPEDSEPLEFESETAESPEGSGALEHESETAESPKGSAADKDDDSTSSYTVFPQDREEFKDVTVLTYVVDPNTGIGKWLAGNEERPSIEKSVRTEDQITEDPSASDSASDYEGIEESDEYDSEVSEPQDARLPSTTDLDTPSHNSNFDNYHHNSADEAGDYILENYGDRTHETTNKGKGTKLQKVLQHIPKTKVVHNEEEHEDNLSHPDDKTATDLYVLVSLLPTSEESTNQPVKYVKHPGERKYYYLLDYTDDDDDDDSTNES